MNVVAVVVVLAAVLAGTDAAIVVDTSQKHNMIPAPEPPTVPQKMISFPAEPRFEPTAEENWVPSDELGFFDVGLTFQRQVNSRIWLAWTAYENTITFALAINTTGWLGFGVSETGAMVSAEICAVYEDESGTVRAFTHWSHNYTYPFLSGNQHCHLLNYTRLAGESMAVFSRNLISCKPEGVDVYVEWDNRFIFAFGDSQVFTYHGLNVGAAEFNARAGEPPLYELPDDATAYMGVMLPHVIGPVKEFYLCRPGEFPADRRYHIVMTEPYFPTVISPAQHHHLNFFVCKHAGGWPPGYEDGQQKECTNPLGLECAAYFYSWLMGQQQAWYMDAALPVGKDVAQWYVMQEHIHNPYSQEGLYDGGWGLKFWYTPTLLPEECGNIGMIQWMPVSGIPPRTPNFTVSAECGDECTRAGIPETGVYVMAVMPHMHRVGVEVGVQHFRYNQSAGIWVELPMIHRLSAWDPNWQGWRHRRQNIQILPGDYVRMYCRYDSSNWTVPVYNGEGYDDEMCMTPMMVRPRVAMTGCLSMDFGVSEVGNSFCVVDVAPGILPLNPIYNQPYIPRAEDENNCPAA